MLRAFDIMAFKHVAGSSLNSDENTFYWQSKCYQAVLRFHISLKEKFSNSICLGIMENWDRKVSVLISVVFLTHQHADS